MARVARAVAFLALALALIVLPSVRGDTTAPAWVAGFPSVASRTGSSVTVANQLNEPGLVYVVVLTWGSQAPTVAEVKARTGSGGAVAVASAVKVRCSAPTRCHLDIATHCLATR